MYRVLESTVYHFITAYFRNTYVLKWFVRIASTRPPRGILGSETIFSWNYKCPNKNMHRWVLSSIVVYWYLNHNTGALFLHRKHNNIFRTPTFPNYTALQCIGVFFFKLSILIFESNIQRRKYYIFTVQYHVKYIIIILYSVRYSNILIIIIVLNVFRIFDYYYRNFANCV